MVHTHMHARTHARMHAHTHYYYYYYLCVYCSTAGVLLKPLCFVLEWAPGGSLHSVLQKYRKADARISPLVLQETARQVITL